MDATLLFFSALTAALFAVIGLVSVALNRRRGEPPRRAARVLSLAAVLLFAALVAAVLIGGLFYPYFLPEPVAPSSPPPKQWRTVLVFAYDAKRDTDPDGNILCSDAGLVALRRDVPSTTDAIGDAVREQLGGGLSGNESAAGLTTELPSTGVQLMSADLSDGVLTLTLADPYSRTGGGSCRVSIMRAQLEAAARQFPSVRQVHILPEEAFQP